MVCSESRSNLASHGRGKAVRLARGIPVLLLAAALGGGSREPLYSPAIAQDLRQPRLPTAPASGEMGFVVYHFVPSVIQGQDACPAGAARKTKDIFLSTLPPEEAQRLQLKENEAEFKRRFFASVTRADGADICSQYSSFPDRPLLRQVQSQFAWGLNLDDDVADGSRNPEGCAHQNFKSPDGLAGIDNQAYRALGCKLEWRGVDGKAGDIVRGLDGFSASGEFTQVILLRGVDSLENDDDVEVIYGNTPDRPVLDSTGKFIWNASFTISNKPPRERNVLHGRIVNGVLTTEPTLIKLTQTWGQRAQTDLRGIRSRWTLNKGRLRLAFQPDGTLKGIVGGYQPLAELVTSPSLGGLGSVWDAGIDCAGEYNTLKKLADGNRDPRTGQCTTISSGLELAAVPAFVNDVVDSAKLARQ